MTHNICFILLAVDKENNNDPLKIWGLYLFVLAFPGECVNQLGSEVKSIPERSAGWFKTLDMWHRLMLCDIKKCFFIDMKFVINQAISQTITQLSCIQLETPSSRLWNFWWIKTYTTFNYMNVIALLFFRNDLTHQGLVPLSGPLLCSCKEKEQCVIHICCSNKWMEYTNSIRPKSVTERSVLITKYVSHCNYT